MSHTTTYNDIEIKSIDLIVRAVLLLKNEAVAGKVIKCELLRNVEPRMYFEKQLIRDGHKKAETDLVLYLNNCKYDIGFNWNEKKQAYDIIYDGWNRYVQNEIGYLDTEINAIMARKREQAQLAGREAVEPSEVQKEIGRFLKCYSIAASQQAIQETGYTVSETSTTETGQMKVLLETSI